MANQQGPHCPARAVFPLSSSGTLGRQLGYGLEAKAIEAVKQWRFQPALKDDRPVNVQISVEVAFRVLILAS